jgi:DNA-nicking Smr family endonuclease
MSRRRQLTEEERALWRGVARSIKPLRPSRRIVTEPSSTDIAADEKKSAERPILPERPLRSLPVVEAPRPRNPPLAPLDRRLKQRVARGSEPIDARLDLHGYTQARAHTALLAFLQRAQRDGARVALVVTGKGGGRADPLAPREHGVLKRQVPIWLALPEFRSLVLGFEAAHVGHGGEGALYVRLRRQRSGRASGC